MSLVVNMDYQNSCVSLVVNMDYHNSQYSLPSHPIVFTLLLFTFILKCCHFLCVCCYVGKIFAAVLRAKYKSVCVFSLLMIVSFFLFTCVVVVLLSDVSGLPVLSVMNVCTFLGFLLTLYQLWLPIKLIFLVMNCLSYCSSGAYALIYYYQTQVPKLFMTYKKQFKPRWLVALCMCILMGIASCCGVGLLFALALTTCRHLNLLVLRHAFTIPHISLPLDEHQMNQLKVVHGGDVKSSNTCSTLKRPRGVGKENACQGDNIPPPKRGRKSKTIGP